MSDARNAGEPSAVKLTDVERQRFKAFLREETHPEVIGPLSRALSERRETPYLDGLLRRLWRQSV